MPVALGVALTNRCNLTCPICYYEGTRATPYDFPLHDLESLLADLAPSSQLLFALEGEPLCHPRFPEAIALAARYSQNIAIVSNGSLLNQDLLEALTPCPIARFSLSADSPDPDIFAKARKGLSLPAFLHKAALLARFLEKAAAFHVVITNRNVHTIADLARISADVGIRAISVALLRPTPLTRNHNILLPTRAKLQANLEALFQTSLNYGITLQFDDFFFDTHLLKWFNATAPANVVYNKNALHQCHIPWQFTGILAHHRQLPCCGDFPAIPRKSLSFDTLFNSPFLIRLRTRILANDPPAICQNCRPHFPD